MLSPDGSKLAFFEKEPGSPARLMTMSSAGGQRQEVQAWSRMRPPYYGRAAWTSDNRHLTALMVNKSQSSENLDWFLVPLDGSTPTSMGAADAFKAVGLTVASAPMVMVADRAIFAPGRQGVSGFQGLWEIFVTPGSWSVHGTPRRLTFGMQSETAYGVAANGSVSLDVSDAASDIYLLPLAPETGTPAGIVRRLTHDKRAKELAGSVAGDPGTAYFMVSATENRRGEWRFFGIDLSTGKQTLAFRGLPLSAHTMTISPDGRQIAYSIAEGNSQSIRMAGTDANLSVDDRLLCQGCGFPFRFSPDGRFLLYSPIVQPNDHRSTKRTIRLLEISTGKDKPWIEDQSDSMGIDKAFGTRDGWVLLEAQGIGPIGPRRGYLAPWKEDAVPRAEWIEMPLPDKNGNAAPWNASPTGNFFYAFRGVKLMVVRFDPRKRAFSEPREIVAPAGSAIVPKPGDHLTVRAQGLVFEREEASNSAVWLMKPPQ